MKIAILFLGLVASFVLSQNARAMSLECEEKAAGAIINFLSKEEPQSDLHLVKNKKGDRIVALTDAAEIYSTFKLDRVVNSDGQDGVEILIFRDGDSLVFAHVKTTTPRGRTTCQVLKVDSGRDDHD
jgi:hypothetical protein